MVLYYQHCSNAKISTLHYFTFVPLCSEFKPCHWQLVIFHTSYEHQNYYKSKIGIKWISSINLFPINLLSCGNVQYQCHRCCHHHLHHHHHCHPLSSSLLFVVVKGGGLAESLECWTKCHAPFCSDILHSKIKS